MSNKERTKMTKKRKEMRMKKTRMKKVFLFSNSFSSQHNFKLFF
jgi:hypothetical protein